MAASSPSSPPSLFLYPPPTSHGYQAPLTYQHAVGLEDLLQGLKTSNIQFRLIPTPSTVYRRAHM